MQMDDRVSSNIEALSRAALDHLFRILKDSLEQRGRFTIALSGGRTPAKLYSLWAQSDQKRKQTPWDHVHLFWGDERYVPMDDPLSNYRMARETLISQVPTPEANVHPVRTNLPTPREAAQAYDAELRKFFGSEPPAFDLQLLGLGGEGHTASLFPDSPALEEKRRWVVSVEAPVNPSRRLTFTPRVLNCGRHTFFLVAGADKREIVAALRNESHPAHSKYPAARIHPAGPVIWFLDDRAAH
jgi:6-phosphogluconolactonase